MLKKLKELEAEADDDEEIVSDLIPQSNSDHNNESRDHIIKKSTVLPKRICEIGYNSFTIMHFLEKISQEKDRYNKTVWVQLENGNIKITGCGSHSKSASSGGRR